MKIKGHFKESFTFKIINALFISKNEYPLVNSLMGKITTPLHIKGVTLLCALSAVTLLWYEKSINPYISNLLMTTLPPFFIISALVFADKKLIKLQKLHYWGLGFLLAGMMSGVLAVISGIDSMLVVLGWGIYAQFFIAIFVGQAITYKKIGRILALIGIPSLVYSFYQFITGMGGSFSLSYLESVGVRATGFFSNPNVFGMVATIIAILSISRYFKYKEKTDLIFFIMYVLGAGLSFSRSAWLGLIVGILMVIYMKNPKAILFTPIFAACLFFDKVRERIMVIFSAEYLLDSSIDGRIWAINNGLYIFKKNPFFGTGPGTYGGRLAWINNSPVYLEGIQQGYTALHTTDNQWVAIMVHMGTVGVLAFIGFIISLTLTLIKSKESISKTALAVLVSFLFMGFFANIIEFGAVVLPVGIILGVAIGRDK